MCVAATTWEVHNIQGTDQSRMKDDAPRRPWRSAEVLFEGKKNLKWKTEIMNASYDGSDSSCSNDSCHLFYWSSSYEFPLIKVAYLNLAQTATTVYKNTQAAWGIDFSGFCAALPRSCCRIEWLILLASGSTTAVRQHWVATSQKVLFLTWAANMQWIFIAGG